MKKFRVLVSVSDKGNLFPFINGLRELGYEFISTGGTAKFLRGCDVAVTDVSEVTGFQECFEGRVKTLHPKVHGGLLYRRHVPEDVAKAAELGILPIDIVVVNLYPFQATIAKPDIAFDDAIEKIDIGGPAMIRAAAKNHRDVIVVCDPADYDWILRELKKTGDLSKEHRLALAQKVFKLMSNYDGAIDTYLSEQSGQITEHLHMENGHELAYAENRCQNPAFIFSGGGNNPLAISKFQVVAGQPSFIAMADASRLVDVMCLMAESFRRSFGKTPYIVIVGKHGNPCGASIDWDYPERAIIKALKGDSVAVMGGELISNFPIDDEIGHLIYRTNDTKIGRPYWGLDEVLAPAISETIIELLGKKEKRRLLVNLALADPPFINDGWMYRYLYGGDWLKQRLSPFVLSPGEIQSWTNRPLEGDDLANLLIAWAIAWRATSNTVALAKNLELISLGCGQQDRIACVRLCLDRANRAGHDTKGSVVASDAFFPFAKNANEEEARARQLAIYYAMAESCKQTTTDEQRIQILPHYAELFSQSDRREGTELLRDAGCVGGVVPADGKHLPEVKEFFRQAGMRVAFVAPENRGFAQH